LDKREPALKQALSLFDATAISVGAIVGAGIFVVTGIAAGYAGSALVVSMLLAAAVSFFTVISFAELAANYPKEGSVYEYGYQLVSPFAGFATGWMWMLSNTFAGAAVSLTFAYYVTALIPALAYPNIIAAVLCLTFTVLNYHGIRESALINNFLVSAKLVILAFFCIFGLFFVNRSNFVPFVILQPGVLYGAYFIFFAYGGFARVAVIAEEIRDAKRNVPRAMLLSLAISTVFYIVVGLVAVGLAGPAKLATSNSPLKEAISVSGNVGAAFLVSVGGLLATASVLLTSIIGVSRMAYAMARRGDLPRTMSRLHMKHGTPHYAICIVGVLMTLLVLFIDLSSVIAISTFAMLFYYASANISALRLAPDKMMYPRTVPMIGVATCIGLLGFILFVSAQAWIVGILGLFAGSVYYVVKQKLSAPTRTSA